MRQIILSIFILIIFHCGLIRMSNQELQSEWDDEVIRLEISNALEIEWNFDLSKLSVLTGDDIFIWDTVNWELLYKISDAHVYSIAWHPNQNIFAGLQGGTEERLIIWDGETGELRSQIMRPLSEDIIGIVILHTLSWSPNGTYLASDSLIDNIVLWDWQKGEYKTLFSQGETIRYGITNISWDKSASYLLSSGLDGIIRIWDAETGDIILEVDGYKYSAWNPNEISFAGVGFNHSINIWNIESGLIEKVLTKHTSAITSLGWNPNGEFISSTDSDGNLVIWNYFTDELLSLDLLDGLFVTKSTWRPDGLQLIISTRYNIIVINP